MPGPEQGPSAQELSGMNSTDYDAMLREAQIADLAHDKLKNPDPAAQELGAYLQDSVDSGNTKNIELGVIQAERQHLHDRLPGEISAAHTEAKVQDLANEWSKSSYHDRRMDAQTLQAAVDEGDLSAVQEYAIDQARQAVHDAKAAGERH